MLRKIQRKSRILEDNFNFFRDEEEVPGGCKALSPWFCRFVWKSKPKQIAGKIDFRKLNHQFHKTFVDNQGWLTKGQIASSSYKKDEQKASIF